MMTENPVYVDDLRFALDVLEEYSHLGLDSEHATKLREVMLEQIEKGEQARQDRVARRVNHPADIED